MSALRLTSGRPGAGKTYDTLGMLIQRSRGVVYGRLVSGDFRVFRLRPLAILLSRLYRDSHAK